jgi:hypothetical protein
MTRVALVWYVCATTRSPQAVGPLLAITSYSRLWRYVSSARYVHDEALPAAPQLHLDRVCSVSPLGYALAIPAAFLSTPRALTLIFLTTALARTIARRVLTPSATPQRGSAARLQGQDAHMLVDDE